MLQLRGGYGQRRRRKSFERKVDFILRNADSAAPKTQRVRIADGKLRKDSKSYQFYQNELKESICQISFLNLHTVYPPVIRCF
jgi:hypothetical protein